MIRVEDVHDAADRTLVRPPARIACGLHGRTRRAVVRAIAGEDLRPPRHGSRDLDRVLVGVGARQCEEDLVDIPGQERSKLRAQPRPRLMRHERADVGQLFRLALDRLDDPAVAVPGVDAHQLAVEVHEPPAVGGVEVDALGARHGQRLQPRLCHPVIQGVAQAELGDLVGAEGLDGLHHHARIVLGSLFDKAGCRC